SVACALSLALVAGIDGASGQTPGANATKYVPDKLLVRFKPGTPAASRAAAHADLGSSVVKRFETVDGLEHVKLPPGLKVEDAIRNYRRNPNIRYAEPDFVVHAVVTPNDPQFSQLWGLSNANDADIDAPEAWNITTGSSNVVVGVIDTGADYNHPDLAANIFS